MPQPLQWLTRLNPLRHFSRHLPQGRRPGRALAALVVLGGHAADRLGAALSQVPGL